MLHRIGKDEQLNGGNKTAKFCTHAFCVKAYITYIFLRDLKKYVKEDTGGSRL
jgi:hypothetical protein